MGRKKLYRNCEICGHFIWSNKWGTRSKTCSKKCRLEINRRTHPKMKSSCIICGTLIPYKRGRKVKTCYPKCTYKHLSKRLKKLGIKPPSQKGKKWGIDYPIENHPWWKGGITPVRGQIWHSEEFQNWRTSIFERDDYTCQFCKQKGGKLQVDHFPITFSEILEMRNIKSLEDAIMCDELWNVDNGRTLCIDCHRLTPTYGVNNRFRKEKYGYTNSRTN